METINTRRTIRKYSDKDVDAKLLGRLLEEASRTQTMGNLQLYSVVVTRSKEGKERLAPAHFNQPMVTEAPVVLTVCADYNRTYENDTETRDRLIRQIVGAWGEGSFIQGPVQFHYGVHTKIGKRFFAGRGTHQENRGDSCRGSGKHT